MSRNGKYSKWNGIKIDLYVLTFLELLLWLRLKLYQINDWKSDFVKNFAIDGIPRFILIDTEGKIINADAPRPSDAKLKELLKENGL